MHKCVYAGIALVVSLVFLVKLGVHLPTILRGFIFYIQITPIAVAYFPDIFNASSEIVRPLPQPMLQHILLLPLQTRSPVSLQH